jgi:hypothetical protein
LNLLLDKNRAVILPTKFGALLRVARGLALAHPWLIYAELLHEGMRAGGGCARHRSGNRNPREISIAMIELLWSKSKLCATETVRAEKLAERATAYVQALAK